MQDLADSTGLQKVAIALTLAFFLDLMYAERPGKRKEASPWYEIASNLSTDLLTARLQAAPQVGFGNWVFEGYKVIQLANFFPEHHRGSFLVMSHTYIL